MLHLSITIVSRAEGEKVIEFSFEYGTRLMSSPERYLLSVFFNNVFNSLTLVQKLNDNELYDIGIARFNRISMPQMKKEKQIKGGDYQCKFYNHIVCIKWYDNKSLMLLRSDLDEITSILTMQRRLKCSSSKIPVNCPNTIKLYNSKMNGVDLLHQLKSAYQINRRLKFRFYFHLFFDLFDAALTNSFIVYENLENEDLNLKELKICIALKQIAFFISRKLSSPKHRPPKRTKAQ